MEKKKEVEHAKWNTQPMYSVVDTAFFLNTAPSNINILIDLNLIKVLKIKTRSIPQFEIERFMKDNIGKDLSKLIKDEQKRQELLKQKEKELLKKKKKVSIA